MSEFGNPFNPSEDVFDNPFDLGSDAFAGNPFEELSPDAAEPDRDANDKAPRLAPKLPPMPAAASRPAPPARHGDNRPPSAPSPASIPARAAIPTAPAPRSSPQPEQAPPPRPAPAAIPPEEDNPLIAEIQRQEQASIFAKPPVFEYGSATEDIENAAQTFEELRVAKAEDFPELEDEKRVSWSVVYGKVTRTLNSNEAKTKKIGEVKASIEASKEFMASLKTAKDKSPRCVVKPRVTAQSKGDAIPAYKGVFGSLDNALQSDKVISLMPSQDGRMYEMRRTELGTFTVPASCRGLREVKAGFIPALPLVPQALTLEIISFFRSLVSDDGSFEAIVNILWDKEREAFCTFVPTQTVSRGSASAELPSFQSRYLHYIDVHSHNTMAARFSAVDDADEKAARVYAVFGCLDRFMPEVSVRISSGGGFMEIDPLTVFEPLGKSYPYPESWDAKVTTAAKRAEIQHEIGGEAA